MSSSRKVAIFSSLVLLLLAVFAFYFTHTNQASGLLKISFLNIGQGDSIYIEAPNGTQFIVDGAPADGRLPFQSSEL